LQNCLRSSKCNEPVLAAELSSGYPPAPERNQVATPAIETIVVSARQRWRWRNIQQGQPVLDLLPRKILPSGYWEEAREMCFRRDATAYSTRMAGNDAATPSRRTHCRRIINTISTVSGRSLIGREQDNLWCPGHGMQRLPRSLSRHRG
jgi:hypothetical protein